MNIEVFGRKRLWPDRDIIILEGLRTCKAKGKVVPVLKYGMKAYGGGGGCIDPNFLDLGPSWR
jgi:hypothetical protein